MKKVKDWNNDIYHAISLYDKVLSIIGIWPLNAAEFKSIARCFLAILIQVSIDKIIFYVIEIID